MYAVIGANTRYRVTRPSLSRFLADLALIVQADSGRTRATAYERYSRECLCAYVYSQQHVGQSDIPRGHLEESEAEGQSRIN